MSFALWIISNKDMKRLKLTFKVWMKFYSILNLAQKHFVTSPMNSCADKVWRIGACHVPLFHIAPTFILDYQSITKRLCWRSNYQLLRCGLVAIHQAWLLDRFQFFVLGINVNHQVSLMIYTMIRNVINQLDLNPWSQLVDHHICKSYTVFHI